MIISYEMRFFLYDFISIICFVFAGYLIALKSFVSIAFFILAYYTRLRLFRTIEDNYHPETIY